MYTILASLSWQSCFCRCDPDLTNTKGRHFRLGPDHSRQGARHHHPIPVVDRMVRVDMRTITWMSPRRRHHAGHVSSRSTPSSFPLVEAMKAIIEVENFLYATSQLGSDASKRLRQVELDEILARGRSSTSHQEILDRSPIPGIKVTHVEVSKRLPPDSSGPWRSRPRRSASPGQGHRRRGEYRRPRNLRAAA